MRWVAVGLKEGEMKKRRGGADSLLLKVSR
jgi:hypothetical protein